MLSNLSHIMNMVDIMPISLEMLRIDSKYSLEKVFTELIYINFFMILYFTIY